MAKDTRQVRFIRKNGRVIPIKMNREQKASAAAGVAGAAVAADAARTKRVHVDKKKGLTIDRKKFALQPFKGLTLGDKVVLRKNGKKVGQATFTTTPGGKGKEFAFSFLSVKRKHRGKGYSQILSKQAAREMRRQGGETVFNQVVHPGSLKTNFSRKRDILWKQGKKNKKTGLSNFIEVTKPEAEKRIGSYRDKGVLSSDIFRETNIKGVKQSRTKPFRTRGNKARIAIGATVALAGAYGAFRPRKKEK